MSLYPAKKENTLLNLEGIFQILDGNFKLKKLDPAMGISQAPPKV